MTDRAGRKIAGFFWVFLVSGLTADGAEVCLKSQAQVGGAIVLLGDVADIRSEDRQQQEALRRLELFPTPAAGTLRRLGSQEVRELLGLYGFDATEFQFTGAASTVVQAGRKPARGEQPAATPPAELGPHIVVALHALERGDTIRPTDVELRPAAGPLRGLVPVSQLREAVGFEVTRPVASGEPIDGRALQRPVLVRRGEAVKVFSRGQGVCIRTTARALEDGGRDDLVLLENPENRARYSARVIDRQEAEVFASGVIATAVTPAMRSVAAIPAEQKK